jgi:hypothetical protein
MKSGSELMKNSRGWWKIIDPQGDLDTVQTRSFYNGTSSGSNLQNHFAVNLGDAALSDFSNAPCIEVVSTLEPLNSLARKFDHGPCFLWWGSPRQEPRISRLPMRNTFLELDFCRLDVS